MTDVLAIALASMHHDMTRLDRVALNLANASTPAYKREVVAVQTFAEALGAAASSAGEGAEPEASVGSPAVQVLSDLRPGTVRLTGKSLDLAIGGDGYFEVSTSEGPAYTRRGDFHVDGHGRLVTAQGHPVMGRDGEIVLTTQAPVIDADGNVAEPAAAGTAGGAGGAPLARIRVVRMDDAKTSRRLADGLFAAGSPVTAVGEGQAQLRQGAVENANVNSMQEMVQLMETMRHFESMQKVAQGYDEMVGAAIRRLGDL